MILCRTFPSRWKNLNQFKLLIIQTARRFSDKLWLHYDIAIRKEAAASGSTNWSRVHLDLYNFHTRSPLLLLQAPPLPLPCHSQSLWHLQAIPGVASIATPGLMGAVAGPLAAAGFVSPLKHAIGTALVSTAITTSHGGMVPLPLSVEGGSSPLLGHL